MDTEQILSTIAMVLILLIIYYAGTWQRRKQQKDLKKMQDELKEGDQIITFTGFAGKIEEVLEDRVIVKLYPDNIRISIEKWAIAGLDDRKIE